MNDHNNKSILIVDDDPDMCWALENLLLKEGFRTRTASCGHETLEIVESAAFALVLLDEKLPDVSGLDLACQVRQLAGPIRILVISGYNYREDSNICNAIENGIIEDFISKPFSHGEILKSIKRILQ